MKTIIGFIKKHTYTVFTTFLAILAIILAFIFYFFPVNLVSLNYSIQNIPLLKDYIRQIDNLNITYNNADISNLTVTNIAFWNSGKASIDQNDIPPKAPFEIKFDDGEYEILDANIIYSSTDANNINTLLVDKETMRITFDYLDKSDGFIVQVIHTANNINENNIFGNIKGLGEIRKHSMDKRKSRQGIIFGIVISVLTLIYMFYSTSKSCSNKKEVIISCVVGVIVIMIINGAFYLFTNGPFSNFTTSLQTGIPVNIQKFLIPLE